MRRWIGAAGGIALAAACNQGQPNGRAPDAMPLRYTPKNGVLTVNSGALRELVVREPFTYVGGQRFILGGTADAEQHLFVVADPAKVVQQLYWIQIEELLPGKGDAYDYSSDSTVAFSGFSLPANFRTYTTPAGAGSDRARAFEYITARGYTIPSGGTRVRLVHLPETRSRREVMVVYFESSPRAATDPHALLLERAARGLALVR
jgi:hypothetical protein